MGIFKPNLLNLYKKNDVQGLVKAVSHKDSHVRLQSVRFIAKMKDARAVGALINALRDCDWEVCKAAVSALGELGSKEAVLPLIAFLRESYSDSQKRRLAKQALQEIGLPSDPAIQASYHVAAGTPHDAIAFGSAAVAPLLDSLEYLVGFEHQDARRHAARALFTLYTAGTLDEESRLKILSKREAISHPHIDGGNVCNIPHYDHAAFSLP